jgi:hypothetical protein
MTTKLNLKVDAGPEANDSELDQLTRQLLKEVKPHVESIERTKGGKAPEDAKSLGFEMLFDGLTVELLSASIVAFLAVTQSWLQRRQIHAGQKGLQIEFACGEKRFTLSSSMAQSELASISDVIKKAIEQGC